MILVSRKGNLHLSHRRGYSMIELLVVMGIIGMLSYISITGFQNISKNNKFKTAVSSVYDQITLARQLAISKNADVEVQFLARESVDGSQVIEYDVMRIGLVKDDKIIFQGKPTYLPEGYIFSENESLSSLLKSDQIKEMETELGRKKMTYRAFRFLANGTTDLSPDMDARWFITLLQKKDASLDARHLKNFCTFSINPQNGLIQMYRPQ